ncbi:cytochrome P450 [Streptomyces chartreusis]|uniref:cytochrome P450 n=1 Tax=Streptomyces chartreusis TaxID=1969 RepID=UPI00369DBADC
MARAISEHGPAPWVRLPDGLEVLAVVDADLAHRLLKSRIVSRNPRHWPGYEDGSLEVGGVVRNWVAPQTALNAEGDEHRRLRAPIQGALTAKRVRAMEPVIREVVGSLLDQVSAGEGIVDAVEAFAAQVPLLITTRLLGIAEEQHRDFRRAVAGVFETGVAEAEAVQRMARLTQLLEKLVRDKRRAPADDFTTEMIQQADAGNPRLTDDQVRDQLMLVVSAGLETTVHGIGNLLVALMTRPHQLRLMTSGEASWEQAVNESLRYRPPAEWVPLRWAVADFDDPETGMRFRSGDPILINFGSAGRQPSQCPHSADSFDVTRTPVRHLAFGYGPHTCPGSGLARMEMEIAVRGWFDRFPKCRLAVAESDLRMIGSWIISGFAEIPVALRTSSAR